MQAELGNDPVDSAFTDGEIRLAELLGDDFGTGLRVQEAVADDLTDQFLSAAVWGFGAAFGAEKRRAAFFQKEGAKLEVTRTAKTEFGGGAVDTLRAAFTLDEHGELAGNFVVGGNGQGAGMAADALVEKLERKQGDLRPECHDASN